MFMIKKECIDIRYIPAARKLVGKNEIVRVIDVKLSPNDKEAAVE